MSNRINDQLLQRASEVKTYFEGTALESAIDNLIARNDLEMLDYMVSDAEAEIARQEFHNRDELPEREMPDVH